MMFYAHIVLAISCITFILSFIVFINRIQTHHNLLQSDETIVIYNYDDSQIQPPSYDIINRNKNSDTSDEQTNEKLLREKVLGSNKTFNTILDRLTFINPPKLVCVYPKFTEHFMLILVLSRGLNFDYRQAIRATWGRNGKFKKSNISVKTIFFVGTDDTVQSAIRNEQTIFNDVIEIGIPENYPFVAHKELASLLWTRLYCPLARMIFRADDDIFLDTALLLNYIQSNINLDINDGLYGWFRFNNSVHRADKWAVTKLEYESKIYPPYTFGIGYLFSNISCQRLINAANQPDHEIIRIGDVYITGILRDMAQISYYDFRDLDYAYTFYEAIPCDEYFEKRPQLLICMSKLHIGLRGDPYEFYDVWDIIVARHNKSLLDTSMKRQKKIKEKILLN